MTPTTTTQLATFVFRQTEGKSKRNAVSAFFAHLKSSLQQKTFIHVIYSILYAILAVAPTDGHYCFVDHIRILERAFLANLEFSGIHPSNDYFI